MNLVVMAIGRVQEDRHDDVCTAEQFQQALEGFHGDVRYEAANLAAHNWDVVRIDDTILIAGPNSGTIYNKDGKTRKLTSAELDLYYPRVTEHDYQNPSITIYNNGSPFNRQRLIQLGHLGVEGRRFDAIEAIMTRYRWDTAGMNKKRVSGEYWDDERQLLNYHRRCKAFREHTTAIVSKLF